jgi:hypothetical protein
MLGDTDAQGYVHLEAQMPRLRDLDALEIQRLRDSETHTLGSLDSGAQMLGCSQTLGSSDLDTQKLRGSEAWRLRCTGAQTQTYMLRDLEDWKIRDLEAQRLRCSGAQTQTLRLGCSETQMLDTWKLRLRGSEAQMLGGLDAQVLRCSDSDTQAWRLRTSEAQRLGRSEAQMLSC